MHFLDSFENKIGSSSGNKYGNTIFQIEKTNECFNDLLETEGPRAKNCH
jgi:hypothetical protein